MIIYGNPYCEQNTVYVKEKCLLTNSIPIFRVFSYYQILETPSKLYSKHYHKPHENNRRIYLIET